MDANTPPPPPPPLFYRIFLFSRDLSRKFGDILVYVDILQTLEDSIIIIILIHHTVIHVFRADLAFLSTDQVLLKDLGQADFDVLKVLSQDVSCPE